MQAKGLKTLAMAATLAVVTSVASAEGPDAGQSLAEPVIVGNASGRPMGPNPPGFDVVVKDMNGTGLVGREVSLYFSNSPVRVFRQADQNPGTTVDATSCIVSRVTGAGGHVNFALRFGRFTNTSSVQVSCEGVPLRTIKARTTDIDGVDGRTFLGDFVIFANNYLSQPATSEETDYNGNGPTDVSDLAEFVEEFTIGAFGVYCP